MARLSDEAKDKSLWLTLAQSWMRLAEHVERAEIGARAETGAPDLVEPSEKPDQEPNRESNHVA